MSTKFAVIVLGILTVVLLSMIGVVVYLGSIKPAPKPSAQLPPPSTQKVKSNLFIEPVIITHQDSVDLELWVSPQKDSVGLSTLAIKADITPKQSKLTPLSSNNTVSDTFKAPGWTYPFNTITRNPDGSVTSKISLVYATPEAFPLNEKTLLLTLPLSSTSKNPQDISVVIDPEVSKAYDKSGGEYGFAGAGQPLVINVQ